MEDTKQRILKKSLELFSTKGYDAVSVGEIAKAVGIKAPSLYNHFPSKQAIFDAIVESTAATTKKIRAGSTFMCRMLSRTALRFLIFRSRLLRTKSGRSSCILCTISRSVSSAG